MNDIPSELSYTREHEWIRIENSTAYVGITHHAQKSLGDIVYVELPSVGEEIDAADEFGTIESVKAVSSLFIPVSGKVIEVNSEVAKQPELINEDCYDAWLIRIEITNPQDKDSLMNASEYEEFLLEDED